MALAQRKPTRSQRARVCRCARWVAGGCHVAAHLLMWAAVWGGLACAAIAGYRAAGTAWDDPWQLWAMVEWGTCCLAASYLLWSTGDWVLEEFASED